MAKLNNVIENKTYLNIEKIVEEICPTCRNVYKETYIISEQEALEIILKEEEKRKQEVLKFD